MNDSIREVTNTSWFGRIQRSVGGVLVGLLLIAGMVYGLFWNEGRAVQTERALNEGAGLVVSVANAPIDQGNDGKLIHVSGPVVTEDILDDSEFGITTTGIRLERKVEMFQWVEEKNSKTETQLGGGEQTVTTYTYKKEWHEGAVDSSEFREPNGHQNPPAPIESRTFQIENATLGDFALSQEILGRAGNSEALPVKAAQEEEIADTTGLSGNVSVIDGVIHIGTSTANPRVGDLRVSYSQVPLTDISVVGEQDGDGFTAYQTQAGDALLLVETGSMDAAAMFKSAQDGNNLLTWILRVVGLVLLFIGFTLLVAPLAVVADVLPFLGSIVRMGTGLISFVLAVLLGTATIAVAWFFYRPILSLIILAVGLAIVTGVVWLGRQRAAGKAAKATAAA